MKRLYRYVLAGSSEETKICAKCGNERTRIKRCEHCGCDYTFVMQHKGEKAEETSLTTVSKIWRKEEITKEERSRFVEDKHDTKEFSKYPSRVPNKNLKKIRKYKVYLSKILFGKLLKSKYPINKHKEELRKAGSNGIFKEIIEEYFYNEMSELVENGLSEDEARKKILSSISDRLIQKNIPTEKKKTYIKHIKLVRKLSNTLTDAIRGYRQELSRISGDGFYDAIIGVYFTNEITALMSEGMSSDLAYTEIRKTMHEELEKKLGSKIGPVYKKYIELIESLSDGIDEIQVRTASNISYYRRNESGFYIDEDKMSNEIVDHTDISFINATSDEIQAGDVLLAVDAMPGMVRQLSDASDCWYANSNSKKLFRVVDPLTQVYEHHMWGFESNEMDTEQPYRSVVRAYLEDVFHIREDIEDNVYSDILSDIVDISSHKTMATQKQYSTQYMNQIADAFETDTEDDDSDGIDNTDITYHATDRATVFPALSDETQKKVNKAVEKYRKAVQKIEEAKELVDLSTKLTHRQKQLAKRHNKQKETVEKSQENIESSKEKPINEELNSDERNMTVSERVSLHKKLLKEIELEKLEKKVDKLAGDELTLKFDSPYLSFGYSPPSQMYNFVFQLSTSPLTYDAENRVKLFFDALVDITDCTTKDMKHYLPHNPSRRVQSTGTLNYEYNIYKNIKLEDIRIIEEWGEERRQRDRAEMLINLREKGISEEDIRRKLFGIFDMEKDKGHKDDCRFIKNRRRAQRKLRLRKHMRHNLFKFHHSTAYRIKRNTEDIKEAKDWASRNPLDVNTDEMYIWLRSIAIREYKANRNQLFRNLCWVSKILIPTMNAIRNGYNIQPYRIITKDEATSFLAIHKAIENSKSLVDLNLITQIMRKRKFLIVKDEPLECPQKTNVFICTVSNKICRNTEKCSKRKRAVRNLSKDIKHTLRYQLLASEEVGVRSRISIFEELRENPNPDKLFGRGPSIIDKITPLEEMYLSLMIAGKRKFLTERMISFNKLDELVKSEAQTDLPPISLQCPRYREDKTPKIEITDNRPRKTYQTRGLQCSTTLLESPTFARIKGDKGHLFIRCEVCGKRAWILSEDEKLIDIRTLEEFYEQGR